ncbi:uncharacterized protein L203_103416 [Cryptococcus depauperatus CBS 7841]|uniref:Uncharacterized protein n=1 Tax=Cryptococcus depauperatus CBS 7841 TaxID=1295531 RepID=A0AAJ8M183_9TREE
MPSLETAGFQSTISDSTIIGASTVTQWSTGSRTHSATSTGYIYSYATSKIVRAAVAAGVIVLCLAAVVLFFKISSGIRLRQRLRRQRLLALSLKSEQQANAYEVAAWADEPSSVPVRGMGSRVQNKKNRKERKDEMRTWKREGANAYALHEWEGIAS